MPVKLKGKEKTGKKERKKERRKEGRGKQIQRSQNGKPIVV